MFSKMILTHCCNYIIKRLEKSKCFSYALTVWNPVRLNLYVGGITLRMYTKIALTIAVTVITTKLVRHIEEQRKIRDLHNRIAKLVQID